MTIKIPKEQIYKRTMVHDCSGLRLSFTKEKHVIYYIYRKGLTFSFGEMESARVRVSESSSLMWGFYRDG